MTTLALLGMATTLAGSPINHPAARGPIAGILEAGTRPACCWGGCVVSGFWVIGTTLVQSTADLSPYVGQTVTSWLNVAICPDASPVWYVTGVTPVTAVESASWGHIKAQYGTDP
jgi:hypothetical protein